MARTNLPVTNLDQAAGITNPTATAVDVANGMNILLASTAIPRAPTAWDLIIVFVNSFAGSKSITVRAGAGETGAVPTTYGPAFRAAKGDLVHANAGSSNISYVGPFDPSRFAQADGSINIDFTASTTGTVLALLVPHRGTAG